jgi:glucose-6-phosphate isomerase
LAHGARDGCLQNLYQGRAYYDRGVGDPNLTVEARIPASVEGEVRETVSRAERIGVAERLRTQDATLWGPAGTPEISNRLGWLTIAERTLAELDRVEAFAQEVRAAGFADVVLLGMGGSSLAPEVLRRCFKQQPESPTLHVLDTTDAATIREVEGRVELARTLFIVSSKSGGTIEPLSLFAYFFSLREDGSNFVAITDPGSPLAELAREHSFRHTFLGDPDIGGRYSALSCFGIVPAAVMGVDVRALLAGAPRAWETGVGGFDASAGVAGSGAVGAVSVGAALSALARAGRDKLTFVIPESLSGLGLWLEQLVAESTGKHATGILPVAEEPLGPVGDYGDDRVFVHLSDAAQPDARLQARMLELADAGHPLISMPTNGPRDLGRVFLFWELAVAVAGWGLEINPFDQPNVQQAKDATGRVLAEYESLGKLGEPEGADGDSLRALLSCAPPSYVAIMAYAQPSAELDDAVRALRAALRESTHAASTFGYGPRFLHSTGQFHKGGPRTGRFLQLLHDGRNDVQIPGKRYTFTVLKHAQAIGDLRTLRELGLPAEQLTLEGENPASALRALTSEIKEPR